MSRYRVHKATDWPRRWGILDRELWGYCSLVIEGDDGKPALLPLLWDAPEGAEAWLQHCYREWERGTVPAPARWRPLPPMVSPWVVPDQPPSLPADAWDAWR